MEEWRAIEGWPYEVSNSGQVRRTSADEGRTFVGKVLRHQMTYSGYAKVFLCAEGIVSEMKVHRLVCAAFHGEPPPDKPIAAHDDGDKTNNSAENLYWASFQENSDDTVRHGRSRPGEANNLAKLTDADAVEILARADQDAGDLAAQFGVSKKTIRRVWRGETFAHVRAKAPVGANTARCA